MKFAALGSFLMHGNIFTLTDGGSAALRRLEPQRLNLSDTAGISLATGASCAIICTAHILVKVNTSRRRPQRASQSTIQRLTNKKTEFAALGSFLMHDNIFTLTDGGSTALRRREPQRLNLSDTAGISLATVCRVCHHLYCAHLSQSKYSRHRPKRASRSTIQRLTNDKTDYAAFGSFLMHGNIFTLTGGGSTALRRREPQRLNLSATGIISLATGASCAIICTARILIKVNTPVAGRNAPLNRQYKD
ncbi:hypothetical protein V5799_001389 [Amblyomma americanum]|uniref:Uncharacterized protein n=1 Tax=Amblyomma americanum TaxID=6943 RepID=A0AAQ4D0B8_AMBAM